MYEKRFYQVGDLKFSSLKHNVLMCAAEVGHADVVDILLSDKKSINCDKRGCITEIKDSAGNLVSSLMAESFPNKGVQCFDVNTKNPDGMTTLMLAAYKGHRQTVVNLLLNGAKVNDIDKQNQTALDWAGFSRDKEKIRKILEKWDGDPGENRRRITINTTERLNV